MNNIEKKIDRILEYLELFPEVQKLKKEKDDRNERIAWWSKVVEVEFPCDPRSYKFQVVSNLIFGRYVINGFDNKRVTVIKDTRANLYVLAENYFKYWQNESAQISICTISDFNVERYFNYDNYQKLSILIKTTDSNRINLSDYIDKKPTPLDWAMFWAAEDFINVSKLNTTEERC